MNERNSTHKLKIELIDYLFNSGAYSNNTKVDILPLLKKYDLRQNDIRLSLKYLKSSYKFKLHIQPDNVGLGKRFDLDGMDKLEAFIEVPANQQLNDSDIKKYLKENKKNPLEFLENLEIHEMKSLTHHEMAVIEDVGNDKIKIQDLIRNKLKEKKAFEQSSQVDLKPYLLHFKITDVELKDILSNLSKNKVIFETGDFLKLGMDFDDGKGVVTLRKLPSIKAYLIDLNEVIQAAKKDVGQKHTFDDIHSIYRKSVKVLPVTPTEPKIQRIPFYKRWYFYLLIIVFVLILILRYVNIDWVDKGNSVIRFMESFPVIVSLLGGIIIVIFQNRLSQLGDFITGDKRNLNK